MKGDPPPPPWVAFPEPDTMPGIEQEHNKILLNDIALCNKNFPEINMYIMILEVLRLYSACKCHKMKTFKSFFLFRQKQPLPLHTPKIILIFPNQ